MFVGKYAGNNWGHSYVTVFFIAAKFGSLVHKVALKSVKFVTYFELFRISSVGQ